MLGCWRQSSNGVSWLAEGLWTALRGIDHLDRSRLTVKNGPSHKKRPSKCYKIVDSPLLIVMGADSSAVHSQSYGSTRSHRKNIYVRCSCKVGN